MRLLGLLRQQLANRKGMPTDELRPVLTALLARDVDGRDAVCYAAASGCTSALAELIDTVVMAAAAAAAGNTAGATAALAKRS